MYCANVQVFRETSTGSPNTKILLKMYKNLSFTNQPYPTTPFQLTSSALSFNSSPTPRVDEIDIDNKTASSSYILPTASSSTLGGVKVGSGLSIDGNGVLSNIYLRSNI